MQQTRLSRRWLVKIMIFLVAATGLGLWGLFDATMAYPTRGRAHAEYMEYQYLSAMAQAGLSPLPIIDPLQTLELLEEKEVELETARASAEASGNQLDAARAFAELLALRWLESLKVVGDLTPERVLIDNPRLRLSELSAKWQAKDQPKPLSALDLPMQWGFVIVGFGLTSYLLLLVAMVGSKKYRYEPESRRLTFPGGATITPGDIEDIDKRKWDKFIVQIKHGDKWRKLDLLRYDPLEKWFLEMEKETSFYEPPEEGDGDEDDFEQDKEVAESSDEVAEAETA